MRMAIVDKPDSARVGSAASQNYPFLRTTLASNG